MLEQENEPYTKLLEREQFLKKKLNQAYSAGMSDQIIDQLQKMIDEIQFEMYNQSEIQKYRSLLDRDDDDEDYIVR